MRSRSLTKTRKYGENKKNVAKTKNVTNTRKCGKKKNVAKTKKYGEKTKKRGEKTLRIRRFVVFKNIGIGCAIGRRRREMFLSFVTRPFDKKKIIHVPEHNRPRNAFSSFY